MFSVVGLAVLIIIIAIHVNIVVPVIISRGKTVWVKVEQLFVIFLEVFVELGVFFGEFREFEEVGFAVVCGGAGGLERLLGLLESMEVDV